MLFAIAVFRKAALRDAQRGARPREASTSWVVTVPMVAATSVAPSPLESAKPISPWYHVKMTNGQTPAQMGLNFALVGASRDPARFDAADAALSVARRIAGAVRCAPVRRAVRHAEEVREADARARDARDAMLRGEEDGRLSVEGVLSSSDVHLDADASDALVAFRDALADGEQARREAEAFEETAERSDRARAATRF